MVSRGNDHARDCGCGDVRIKRLRGLEQPAAALDLPGLTEGNPTDVRFVRNSVIEFARILRATLQLFIRLVEEVVEACFLVAFS